MAWRVAVCTILIGAAWMPAGAQTPAQTPPQTLGLFEPVEQTAQPQQPAAEVSRPVEVSRGTAPQFVLIGTSNIAGKHRARLRTQSGKVVVVNLGDDAAGTVPGFPGFQIEEAANRQILMRHPANTPCYASPAQGVNCPSSDVARLQLTTAQAIQRSPAAEPARNIRQEVSAGNSAAADADAAQAPPDNPFAAALRAARERAEADPAVSRAEAERFRPRRIDPADVPEGSRLVRTPFGDRIVSEQ